MRLVVPETSQLDTESDGDLLLAVYAGDELERNQAANVFVRRYIHDLYAFCREFRESMGGEDGLSDFVMETFERAFKRAGTFNDEGLLDQKHARARTFRWLTQIAKNLLRDWIKSRSENTPIPLCSIKNSEKRSSEPPADHDEQSQSRRYIPLPDGSSEVFVDSSAVSAFLGEDESAPIPSPELQCLRNALAALKDREREILLMSAQYSIDGKQLRLPADIRKGLCDRWSTTEDNLRAIRKRAKAKLEKFMAEHL